MFVRVTAEEGASKCMKEQIKKQKEDIRKYQEEIRKLERENINLIETIISNVYGTDVEVGEIDDILIKGIKMLKNELNELLEKN